MEIWQIILISFLMVITSDIIIKWEINYNKDLFYDLHRKEIERELLKDEKDKRS